MPVTEAVRRAHDELLRTMPEGSVHDTDSCEVCIVPETAQERTVSDTKRQFSEAEHEAILTEAVRREVASATEALETEKADLQNRIDVLEAEKADALAAKEAAETELEQYKASVEAAKEVESRKEARVQAVKEIAAAPLPDTYFSDQRITRWAEMSDEGFESFLDDMAEQAIAHLDDKQAAEVAGLVGEARRKKIAEFVADMRQGQERAGASTPGSVTTETAAFSGGRTPSSGKDGESTLSTFLGARRGTPVAS